MSQRVYGYKPIPEGSTDSAQIETDRENAASLAKALYTAISIPFVVCCLIYSFLYRTYPRDRERARMQALIDSEMQQVDRDELPSGEEYSQLHFSETKEPNDKERSVIEIEYGDENLDVDDNDKKTLLPNQQTFSHLGE